MKALYLMAVLVLAGCASQSPTAKSVSLAPCDMRTAHSGEYWGFGDKWSYLIQLDGETRITR